MSSLKVPDDVGLGASDEVVYSIDRSLGQLAMSFQKRLSYCTFFGRKLHLTMFEFHFVSTF